MTVLVVTAHPDKNSFTHTWAKESVTAAKNLGHEVLLSDIYTMQFDPIERAEHYESTLPNNKFDVLKTQEFHSYENSLPSEVLTEIDKLMVSELIIFHFPIWWFGPPAALKGWMERVFANGATHDSKNRFDQGKLKGKRAQFFVTTGASEQETSFNGKEGDIQMLLWPISYTLRYLGIDVLPYKIINSMHGYHADIRQKQLEKKLEDELKNHPMNITKCFNVEPLAFNEDADFTDDGLIKETATSFTPFIRHSR